MVLAAIVAAFAVLWPSIPRASTPWARNHIPYRLNYGLDIRGGARLSYDVQIGQAIADRRNRNLEDLREELARVFGIHSGSSRVTPDELNRLSQRVTFRPEANNRQFSVTFRNAQDVERLTADRIQHRGLTRVSQSGQRVLLALRNEEVENLEKNAVQQAIQTISNRIDELAIKETSITARGETIVVEVPGTDPRYFNQIRDIIRRTARLEFKILDDESTLLEDIIQRGGPAPSPAPAPGAEAPARTPRPLPQGITLETEQTTAGPGRTVYAQYLRSTGANARQALEEYLTSVASLVPNERQLLLGREDRRAAPGRPLPREEVWRTYTVYSVAQVDGSMISDALVSFDTQEGQPFVSLTFSRRGGEVFGNVTRENVKRRFAIVMDDKVNSAPVIQTAITGGQARITLGGGGDVQRQYAEANDLVVVLRAGALPAPLTGGKEDYIGPTLGNDTIRSARNAMLVGIALVLAFMAVYYGWAGWIANVAVLLNLLLQLGALALFGATITLPGLAGLALTVGMSVDNNVLINERIREEQRSGKSLRASVDAGYKHAFTAIFDGHVTTFISGIVLLQYGTGPVKGFAVTLLIGIVANLFTGVFATRVVFDWLVRGLKVKSLLAAR
jgi:preprotein translocase subunit SecD